jgi:hypothetical protein
MKKNRRQLKRHTLSAVGIYSASSRILARLVKWGLLSLLLIQPVVPNAAELTVDSQDQLEINRIKSAYLYNFLKYVNFNQSEISQPLEYSVCVLGADPFGSALDAMSGRTAKGIEVKVKRVKDLAEATACHIVYVSQSEKNNLSLILKFLKNRSILTVSDIHNFAQNGGIIGFIGENRKIGIEINLTNARQSHIRISALLLEIARIID